MSAERGFKVIATMRKPEAGTDLATNPNITVMALDVCNHEQIKEVVAKTLEVTNIDVVINNAGYGLLGPLEAIPDEKITLQINTNLTGSIRIAQAFIPHMRSRNKGCIISITSIGGHMTFPFFSMYHATKFALEGFSESLAFELANFGIQVKTVAPGGITTEFSSSAMAQASMDANYQEALTKCAVAFEDPARKAQASTPEQIAEVVFEAATDGKDQVTYIAGEDAKTAYAARQQVGAEQFRAGIKAQFLS